MERMKTFGRYLIMFVLFYIFVDFIMYTSMISNYRNINYTVIGDTPQIEISKSMATAVSGYVEGTVKNITGNRIECIYIKMEFYSKRDVLLGTKYIKVPYFNTNQTKEFRVIYKLQGVSYYKISFTTENMDNVIEEQKQEIEEKVQYWFPFVGLITLICLAP